MLRDAVPAQLAIPTTAFSGNPNHFVNIKHPGYPDRYGQNILLSLSAFDQQEGGLHYGTAIVACGLVVGNIWDGYLTRERDGDPIRLEPDDVLAHASYYFHLPASAGEGDRYPVYPSFQHWPFPHDRLPELWRARMPDPTGGIVPFLLPSASSLTAAVMQRDQWRCKLSEQRDYIETAHLCPRSESVWFKENGMGQYNLNKDLPSDYVIDDVSNAIALRSDIHSAFDDRKFVVVPKHSAWAVHFLELTSDLGGFYHNTGVRLDPNVSMRCLLARFAWAIFPLLRNFLEAGVPRAVRVRVLDNGEYKEVVKTMGSEEMTASGIYLRGRSSSPKKRKPPTLDSSDIRTTRKRGYSETSLDGVLSEDSPKRARHQRSSPEVETLGELAASTPTEPSTAEMQTKDQSPYSPIPPIDIAASTSSTAAAGPFDHDKNVLHDFNDLSELKSDWVRKRRPSDPSLYCCDYNHAEAAIRAGLPGKRKHGGGHLCLECLGFEYRDDIDDVVESDDASSFHGRLHADGQDSGG
ncbi:MAG: hypothetical protein M1819_000804 [Sarea resinae]|nr:MAG: hypothetical protein M1819_000804 [Sarea resinae]